MATTTDEPSLAQASPFERTKNEVSVRTRTLLFRTVDRTKTGRKALHAYDGLLVRAGRLDRNVAVKPSWSREARRGSVEHVIITRFEVDLAGKFYRRPDLTDEEIVSLDRLHARLRLFELFCLPSVAAQTDQGFRWLIFFRASHRSIIEPWLAGLEASAARQGLPFPTIEPVYLDGVFGPKTAGEYLAKPAAHGRTVSLLTTRLDSDDVLHPEFVERVQSAAVELGPNAQRFLTFPRGYVYGYAFPHGSGSGSGRLYQQYHPSNPLISYVEPYFLADTVHRSDHETAAGQGKAKVASWKPMWLQVAHDHNLSTLTDGLRVSARDLPVTFPGVRFGNDTDLRPDLFVDRFLTGGRLIRKIVTSPRARYRLLALLPGKPKTMPNLPGLPSR